MSPSVMAGGLKFSFTEQLVGTLVVLLIVFIAFKAGALILNTLKDFYGNDKANSRPSNVKPAQPIKVLMVAVTLLIIFFLVLIRWSLNT